MTPRVVVTGIGMVTPFGPDRETSWSSVSSGRRAPRRLSLLVERHGGSAGPPSELECFGAPAADGACGDDEPIVRMALRSALEAWRDAGLERDALTLERLGCVVGTSKGGLRSAARLFGEAGGPEAAFARLWRTFLPDAPAAAVAERFDVRGPVLCPVAACATGLVSLQRGVDLIREGSCDVVLAGSTDASLTPLVVGSFQRLGVLARGDDPASACRPFDAHRSGFVIGEGAAVLVLERQEHATARGARPYAEWLSGGSLGDAAGLTHLDPTASGLARLIGDVLDRAGSVPEEVDYANLHGTGTRENDACETRGVKQAFGAAARRLRGSSLKGALGHLLGAAGSVETACTLLALRDGIIPPTANLQNPDPDCDLDCTPVIPRRAPLRTALKLSLGFGGHLAAAVVRRVEGRGGTSV